MNTREKQQFTQHWEIVRKRGIIRYVLLTGLTWGTATAVVTRLVFILLDHDFGLAAFRDELTSPEFLRQWGIFLLGGLCFGLTLWFYYDWYYRKINRET